MCIRDRYYRDGTAAWWETLWGTPNCQSGYWADREQPDIYWAATGNYAWWVEREASNSPECFRKGQPFLYPGGVTSGCPDISWTRGGQLQTGRWSADSYSADDWHVISSEDRAPLYEKIPVEFRPQVLSFAFSPFIRQIDRKNARDPAGEEKITAR